MSPATATETVWDGVRQSYIPPEPLRLDPAVRLHTAAAEEVDGVDYEVLRHALWNVNDEHGVTIEKVSGSPFASNAHDFNTVILTEDGEYVFFGPHIQYFSGAMDMPIKWTLENLGGAPGIGEGDMFLSNDPWVGASHQSDVQLTCPVFWEGKIFCWVANALHQYDIGGNTPGSFCADAETVFDEPVPIPPLKMVEADRIRPDLERMYLRHSRQPELVALDLRAQMAGNIVARNRIHGFIERYGPEAVKAVMRKIISDGEESFVRRLRAIPDGTWRAVGYLEAALPGDRGVYPVTMNVRKEGEMLTFDNRGSHPSVGAVNSTFSGWRAGILCILNPYLCYDQLYSTGGMLRHVRFEPEVGTINCPSFPASVTNSQIGNVFGGALANVALGKMMLSAPELRDEAFAAGGGSVFPMSAIGGVDENGNEFGTGFLDPLGGAIGAFPNRDGVDTGGTFYEPKSLMGNVEQIEQMFPVLYLYRREQPDSGGSGKFRGGNGGAFAVVPHRIETIFHAPSAAGCAVPTSLGLSGGAPACTNRFRMLRGSDVRHRFAARQIPQAIDSIDGEEGLVEPKERGMTQGPDDVWEVSWCAGGGYGDPLEREPEAVLADVIRGAVSTETALSVYGVVIVDGDEEPRLDAPGTAARRDAERRGRLERSRSWQEIEGGDDAGK
ncbi:MAG TPA: hydantoinase B/oxoprolinase family protein [Solirubrobacterales bacterium]|nr:hydantoinase B/oxoprolinase family protein [Solirubrobacterales bacterium]